MLPVVQDLRTLAHLGALEGSRHEEPGDMDEAWRWYRAILRCSRHVGRHGVLIERQVAASQHEVAARQSSAGPRTLEPTRHGSAGP